jgi:hypothetical protein
MKPHLPEAAIVEDVSAAAIEEECIAAVTDSSDTNR